MAQYGRLRAQRAPVRTLGARFAGLVAPSPDKEEGRGRFHPAGVPSHCIDAALKKYISGWLHALRFGGRTWPATQVAPDIATSAFADSLPARRVACEVRNVADLVHPAGVGSHVVYIRVVVEQMAQRVMAVEGEDARC